MVGHRTGTVPQGVARGGRQRPQADLCGARSLTLRSRRRGQLVHRMAPFVGGIRSHRQARARCSPEALCTTDKYDRLYHTYGASTVDVAYSVRGEFRNPPDAIAYPRTEDDIAKLFRWCEDDSLAAIPYGGGTSVVGGVIRHDRPACEALG
jgi:hypothetical protein